MLEHISNFSATEKVIFGLLTIIAIISALVMAKNATNQFLIEVPDHGGELREGLVGLPRSINPVLAVTDIDKDITTLVYSGLTKYDKGEIVPDIAASYEVSEDGLTYDFILRDGVEFQDGKSLTADDVLFTIQKIQDINLKSPRRADWTNITIEKLSENEIRFTLKQAYAPFLGNTTVGILPKHIWGEVNNDQFIFSQYNTEPVGSGPYKIVSIKRDNGGIPTEYRLETWREYYDSRPFIDSLIFNFFSDEEKAVTALEVGKIDSLAAVSSTAARKLALNDNKPYNIVSNPLPRIFGVFFNHNQSSVLADKVVRQALDMSVDRNSLVETIFGGYGKVRTGPLPSSWIGDNNNQQTNKLSDPTEYLENLENAIRLLEKNGWKRNENGIFEKKTSGSASTSLAFDIYTADASDLKRTAELVKDSWAKLGAKVDIKVFESGDLYQNIIRTRKYDALLFGEQIGKDRDLYAFWHSSQRNTPGLNVALYTNSQVDKILEKIRNTTDREEQSKDYIELDFMIRGDIPAAFLYSPDFIYVIPKKLKGVIVHDITTPLDRWNSVTEWYLNTERVWRIFAK